MTQHCHLGVIFNDTLSWKDHVHKIVLQSARKIGLLRRLGRHLSPTVLCDIYLFCIRPGVEYSSVVWSGLSSSDAVRLERNNRSAARLILKTSRKEDISHELLLSRAGLSTLEARRNVAQCAVVRKVVRPTPGSFTEGYRSLGITINHWQPTAIAEKEPLPSKITTAKESEI